MREDDWESDANIEREREREREGERERERERESMPSGTSEYVADRRSRH